ncbi:MAG: hypothetical protein M0D55_16015 [Elusimicrobiota bacterium]|nr:MAG: hypothetical protein M0D55_16015 [Elusimicrobiota bacterium]
MKTNKTDGVRTYEWLWRGSLDDVKNGMMAFLIAPLFALIAVAPMMAIALSRGNSPLMGILIFCGFTLLVSYGVTLFIGLPWYFFLAWFDRAGLLPVMAASAVPLIWIFYQSLSRPHSDSTYLYLMFGSAGLIVSGAYWKMART